jgi:histidinol dehydrogenase
MIRINKIDNITDFTNIPLMRHNDIKNLPAVVSDIIDNVKNKGFNSLISYTKKFDNLLLDKNNCYFTETDFNNSYNLISPELRKSLEYSHRRIIQFNEKQIPKNLLYEDSDLFQLGWRYYPLNSVGIYIPGGLASYPSSLLMTATIAQIAGVKNITAVMPCPNGNYNHAVLATAKILGLKRIYKFGGAQIIAALAYGNDIIPQVDKIVGPGNAYVAEAKRQVYGTVGIDTIAGPSEILVIADKNANPEFIAYDMLSQAEHDVNAAAYLITDCDDVVNNVANKITEILPTLTRKDIATSSIKNNSYIFKVAKLDKIGVDIANLLAPEHLELMTSNNNFFLENISTAGAIFMGNYSTEPIGDYIAGPSHVLPTSGAGRFSSGLSVFDFMKRSSIINISGKNYNNNAIHAINIAEAEGLDAHAKACSIRIEKKGL